MNEQERTPGDEQEPAGEPTKTPGAEPETPGTPETEKKDDHQKEQGGETE